MTRRSTPQKLIDDRAFPVRIFISVPRGGMGQVLSDLPHWLDRHLGRTSYAIHSSGTSTITQALAVYLRHPSHAAAMLEAFPSLEVADGTREAWYTSPNLPHGRPTEEDEPICNLYNQTTTQEAMRSLFAGLAFHDRVGNLEPGRVYPDQIAPIIRNGIEGLELVRARWGLPSPPSVLKTARDPGVTNVRNTGSPHWRRWLGPANRCLVPLTAFAEPRGAGRGNQWFAAADGQPMFFAGIEVRGWSSVRKVKDGETTDDLFAFMTTTPNAEVRAVHPKAMPVILTTPKDWMAWLSEPFELATRLQRPLPDGALALLEGDPG